MIPAPRIPRHSHAEESSQNSPYSGHNACMYVRQLPSPLRALRKLGRIVRRIVGRVRSTQGSFHVLSHRQRCCMPYRYVLSPPSSDTLAFPLGIDDDTCKNSQQQRPLVHLFQSHAAIHESHIVGMFRVVLRRPRTRSSRLPCIDLQIQLVH